MSAWPQCEVCHTYHAYEDACPSFTDTVDGSLWQHATAVCAQCFYRWQAVFPIDATVLECPQCGHLTGTWQATQ